MKITDVKVLLTRGPVRNLCIVKVETDAGYHGWGESGLIGRELAVKGAIEHFREFLIGKNARRIGALRRRRPRADPGRSGALIRSTARASTRRGAPTTRSWSGCSSSAGRSSGQSRCRRRGA